MKRLMPTLLVTAAMSPATVLADDSYSNGWIRGFLTPHAEVDVDAGLGGSGSDDGDGFGFAAELPIAQKAVLTAELSQVEYDDSSLEADNLRLGGGLVGPSGSGVFLEYTQLELDGSEFDGPSIHARLGGAVRDGFGAYGRIGYHFLSGEGDDLEGPEFAGGLEFVGSSGLGLFGEYRLTRLDTDNADSDFDELRVGVTLRF